MRNFLYICRLFNGFETSIKTQKWSPTGVPTIYRLINELDSNNLFKLEVLITAKDKMPWWNYGLAKVIKISGLSSKVTVLSSINLNLGRFGTLAQEVFQMFYIFIKVLYGNYEVIYLDHANIFSASLLSRLQRTPVVFRVMGVYPAMRYSLIKNNLSSKVLRWCYASPFSMVICTQDGSGIEPWLDKAIIKTVPIHKLINGVEFKVPSIEKKSQVYETYKIPKDKLLVLYLGKLEEIKGIYDFIDGFNLANKSCNGGLHAVVIGSGNQLNRINEILLNNSSITLIQRVPHNEIFNFHTISDIYVSPNRLANLTNANLEAMSSGSCMIIPNSQKDTSVDLITDELIGNDSVYRINYPPHKRDIANAIQELFNSSELRLKFSTNIVSQSKAFIRSWDERVEHEIKLLKSLLK